MLGRTRVLGLITAYDADTGHPPAPDTDCLFKAAQAVPPPDLRSRLGEVQPPPSRRRADARRLVPARPLPPELHGRRRVRGLPRSGATAGDERSLPALALTRPAALAAAMAHHASGISFFKSRANALAPVKVRCRPSG